MDWRDLVSALELQPHPEGGYFKETWRSPETVDKGLPDRFNGARSLLTSIYFLIHDDNVSKFHRIKSDELWCWHMGDAIDIVTLSEGGLTRVTLGPDLRKGQVLQHVVPQGQWFASHVHDQSGFALVGCAVAPGFDFADFEMADRKQLQDQWPDHADVISQLT